MLAITREKLIDHLQDVSGLINLYQKRDYGFIEKTIKWLSDVENTLAQLRNAKASFVAVERGKILAVADGYHNSQIVLGKNSKRKATFATTLIVLCDVENVLMRIVDEIDTQFHAWQEKMVQFIAVASNDEAIPIPPTEPRQKWLTEIWENLSKTDKAKNMYHYLNSAMKPSDRYYLLNILIENILANA